MLEGKAVVRETDMSDDQKNHAMELAYRALDLHEVSDCQSIAYYIKKVCFFFCKKGKSNSPSAIIS